MALLTSVNCLVLTVAEIERIEITAVAAAADNLNIQFALKAFSQSLLI